MTAITHAHPLPPDAESRVRGLLDGSLSGTDRQAAMEHLRACAACVAAYDAIATAEHRVAGGDSVLGMPALERVAARLHSDPAMAPPRRRAWAWRAAAAATAATVLVLGLLVGLPPRDDGFTARGGPQPEAGGRGWGSGGEAPGNHVDGVGIRVFLVGAQGAAELKDGGEATVGDELGVSVSTGPYRQLTLTVRSPGGSTALAETTESVARGAIDEPLDWTARVEPAFVDNGGVTVEAVFSEPSPGGAPPVARRVMTLRVKKAAP